MKTTKLLVACLFTFGLGTHIKAQNNDEGPKRPNGIRVGYQYSNMRKDGEWAFKGSDDFYVGYARDFRVLPLLHIQTGLEYMMAGASLVEGADLELNYIVLPVQGVVKLGPISFVGGVNGNFLVSETQKIGGEKITINSDNESEMFDLTLDAGLSVNLWMLSIETRYYWGTMAVNDNWNNRLWQAGIKFNF